LQEVGVLSIQGVICSPLLQGVVVFCNQHATFAYTPPHMESVCLFVTALALMIVWAIGQACLDMAHG